MLTFTRPRRFSAATIALAIVGTLAFAAPAQAEEPTTDQTSTPTEQVQSVDSALESSSLESSPSETLPAEVVPAEDTTQEKTSEQGGNEGDLQPAAARAVPDPGETNQVVVPTNVGCTPGNERTTTITGTSQLNVAETRAGGSTTMTPAGLSLAWGSNSDSSLNKAAWYYPVNFPLTELGSPTRDYAGAGASLGDNYTVVALIPGVSTPKYLGNIVREPQTSYAGYWTTFDSTYGLTDPAGYASKSINDILSQMFAKQPTWTLQVVAIGGSGGSGTVGSGVLASQTAGCITLNYVGAVAPTNQECRATATPITVGSWTQLATGDTRSGGSGRITPTGMALDWKVPTSVALSGGGTRAGTLDDSKVAWYYATDFPLSQLGSPVVDYSVTSGASMGQNFTISVNGVYKGNIVSEPGISNYWTTFDIPGMKPDPDAKYRKAIGTINDFLAAYNSWDPAADVRVIAVGGSGGSGSVGKGVLRSQGFACTVITYAATLPTAPEQIAPANNSVVGSSDFPMSWTDFGAGYTYEIYSTSTDPGTDAVIQNPINGGLDGLPNPYNIQGVPDQVFWWQVRAIDPDGNIGAWSAIWKVTVDTTAPTVPAPMSPGGWNLSADEFTWGASTDATPVTYELVVGDNPNLDADGRISGTVYTDIADTNYPYNFPTGVLHWQVRAKDAAGNYSAWSSPTIVQIMGVPTITSPTAGQNASGSSLTATWTAVYGVGGVDYYEIEYTVTRNGIITTETRTVPGDQLSRVQTFTSNYQGPLSIRVRAINKIGFTSDPASKVGAWSEPVAYFRDTVGPVKPQPLNPSNGGYLTSSSTTVSWTADLADSVSYEVRWSTSPSRDSKNQLNGTDAKNEPKVTVRSQLLTPLAEGYVFWQVRAYDAQGNAGAWSDIWGYAVDTIAPVVTLDLPANGSTFTNSQFSLTWKSGETLPLYLLEVTTVPGVLDDGSFESVSGGARMSSPSTTFDMTGAPDGTYYWHVKAFDAAGNQSAWSPTWTVTIATPPAPPGTTVTPPAVNPFTAIVTPAAAPAASTAPTTPGGTAGGTTTDQLPTQSTPTDNQLPTEAFEGDPTSSEAAPWWPWVLGIVLLLLLALLWFLLFRKRSQA